MISIEEIDYMPASNKEACESQECFVIFVHLGTVRELLLQSFDFWTDRIVPFAVEVMSDDVDCSEFIVGYFDSCGICHGIKFAANLEAGFGRCRGDQLNDHLVTDERLATPIAGDE